MGMPSWMYKKAKKDWSVCLHLSALQATQQSCGLAAQLYGRARRGRHCSWMCRATALHPLEPAYESGDTPQLRLAVVLVLVHKSS